ncbi:MAG: hypothetical protein RJA99_1452 [Pseudomonadota bacterium]|jgi:hypothetical protein
MARSLSPARLALFVTPWVVVGCGWLGSMATPAGQMGFFVTSTGSGQGANYGGLAGADAHCQKLATAAGVGGRVWRAYLSTQATGGEPAVNARDRIGGGPWYNARGVLVAQNLRDLHGNNNLTKLTALDEQGRIVNGRTESPNRHDILTGSQADGTAFGPGEDRTCRNWTSGGDGAAMVGHSDRLGLRDDMPAVSWNASHPSRGCSDPQLAVSGGAGLLYCFAAR